MRFVAFFQVLPLEVLGSWDSRDKGWRRRLWELGVVWRVAVEALHLDDAAFVGVLDPDGVMCFAQGAAGIIAHFLSGRDLAVEAAEQVNEFSVVVQVSFRVISVRKFLKEDLGEAGGGGLETDFGKFGGIIAAEEIQEMILVEAILEDGFLFEPPFEVTASGPIGDVTFDESVATFAEGFDNVFVRHAVPEHAIDHVALEFGKGSDAAVAADFAFGGRRGAQGVWGRRKGRGVNYGDSLGRGDGRGDEVEG